LDIFIDSLVEIYVSCLALGYIPKKWREVKVTFIPKPGRVDYEDARNNRGISLSSFLLKGLERLVDLYIRDNILTQNPLCVNQHAYQRGRSTMSAAYKLTSTIEAALKYKQVALAVFLDIEGAFDRATFMSFVRAAEAKGIDCFIIRWILAMLENRILISDFKGIQVKKQPVMGCPQGGVLSPLIWLLIADNLLCLLDNANILSWGFADDFVILVRGVHTDVVFNKMQQALRIVENFTKSVSLSVNPSKVAAMLFTKRRNVSVKPLRLFNKDISLVNEFKYLGLTLDCKLNWRRHLELRIQKACRTLGQCRQAIGRVWGLSPKVVHWLYTAVVRPVLSYGAVAWWHKSGSSTMIDKLNHLQRLGLLAMTGAMFTTPTAALECFCNLRPLHLFAEAEARAELFRLKNWGHFRPNISANNSYVTLWKNIRGFNPMCDAPNDCMITEIKTDRNFAVQIPARDDWLVKEEWLVSDHTFYTDGSLCSGLAGSGVFSTLPETRLTFSLGSSVSVFQAEILALSECASRCLVDGISESRIAICSDSKAAIQALSSFRFSSKLVLECRKNLQDLAASNSVTLIWVPGHSDIEGNERADSLAREGSSKIPCAPLPVIPLSGGWFAAEVKKWSFLEHGRLWSNLGTCRQTKLFLTKPLSEPECKKLLSLTRPSLRCLIGVITGHFYFNKHLHKMGLSPTPICERCGEYEDTAFHLICSCPRLAQRRNKILGEFFISRGKYKDLSLEKILSFITGIDLRTHL
jgi:ribonuclease HI